MWWVWLFLFFFFFHFLTFPRVWFSFLLFVVILEFIFTTCVSLLFRIVFDVRSVRLVFAQCARAGCIFNIYICFTRNCTSYLQLCSCVSIFFPTFCFHFHLKVRTCDASVHYSSAPNNPAARISKGVYDFFSLPRYFFHSSLLTDKFTLI